MVKLLLAQVRPTKEYVCNKTTNKSQNREDQRVEGLWTEVDGRNGILVYQQNSWRVYNCKKVSEWAKEKLLKASLYNMSSYRNTNNKMIYATELLYLLYQDLQYHILRDLFKLILYYKSQLTYPFE